MRLLQFVRSGQLIFPQVPHFQEPGGAVSKPPPPAAASPMPCSWRLGGPPSTSSLGMPQLWALQVVLVGKFTFMQDLQTQEPGGADLGPAGFGPTPLPAALRPAMVAVKSATFWEVSSAGGPPSAVALGRAQAPLRPLQTSLDGKFTLPHSRHFQDPGGAGFKGNVCSSSSPPANRAKSCNFRPGLSMPHLRRLQTRRPA